jgi:hypothetical protein
LETVVHFHLAKMGSVADLAEAREGVAALMVEEEAVIGYLLASGDVETYLLVGSEVMVEVEEDQEVGEILGSVQLSGKRSL